MVAWRLRSLLPIDHPCAADHMGSAENAPSVAVFEWGSANTRLAAPLADRSLRATRRSPSRRCHEGRGGGPLAAASAVPAPGSPATVSLYRGASARRDPHSSRSSPLGTQIDLHAWKSGPNAHLTPVAPNVHHSRIPSRRSLAFTFGAGHDWQDYITVDPQVCHGKACFKGTASWCRWSSTTSRGLDHRRDPA